MKLFPKGRRFLYFEYPIVWICNFWYWLRRSPIRRTIWKYKEIHYGPLLQYPEELKKFFKAEQTKLDKLIGIDEYKLPDDFFK